jgi:hypothetical protein
MTDTMKAISQTAKHVASEAVVVAGTAVRKGVDAVRDKGYAASLKAPLVGQELPEVVTSPREQVESRIGVVKEKLWMARAAAKFSIGRVKSKCDAAAAGASDKFVAARSTVKVGVDAVIEKCDSGVGTVMSKLDAASQKLSGAAPLLSSVETECVQLLVSMGFARKDAARAVRQVGADDVNSVVEFLCQEPGQRAGTPGWNSQMSRHIARRMLEMQLDEEEDMEIALALSRFQAEASQRTGCNLPHASPFAEFHCWEESSDQVCTHITGMVCQPQRSKAFHLKPSVGTWMLAHPQRVSRIICNEESKALGRYVAPHENVSSEMDLIDLSSTMTPKVVQSCSIVSSRTGAVRCGA